MQVIVADDSEGSGEGSQRVLTKRVVEDANIGEFCVDWDPKHVDSCQTTVRAGKEREGVVQYMELEDDSGG
jgi:hypothetical protein